jgi:CRP/FNR family cyclic AMP-dependent transcriptional regulator
MTEQGILGTFAHHAFLQGLSERHRMLLASGARPITFQKGDYLAREGEPAERFYLIQSGHIAIEARHPHKGTVNLQTIGPGEVVGWSWIVPPHRWHFDVRATGPASALCFDAEWLRDQCERDHELGYHLLWQLLAVVAERVSATRLKLLDKDG